MLGTPNKNGFILPLSKVGTGFSEDVLSALTNELQNEVVSDIPQIYLIDKLKPDVFFKPKRVWEISFDSFSLSPVYFVGKGIVDELKGLSLRFPCFLRERTDKLIDQANSVEEIVDLYNSLISESSK